ncbi:hypothetical protein HYDPIDRAFT_37927 [Hydnomerulius pinastri MD-312]|uniref:EamA domain-containing protein n=1 Tax=Hydnomerulius pinastri MD-312 TaxID=994086 RepID=A0A0C9W7E0_9AGAM|nr:hypothetical protein HYDPIDRAFT_44511 [Hydnomerulius pinastri MD-312]KIJ67395.1 hypothetical protein HYDPIDRAFT_37927 [Hydnomerulius pinastri MD-312]
MSVKNAYLALTQEPIEVGDGHQVQPTTSGSGFARSFTGRLEFPAGWAEKRAQVANFVANNAGLLLVMCAQFFFASMNLSVKLLEGLETPTPTVELITVRMAITVCCCMVYMVANKIPDPFLGPKGVRGLLVARGFAGFFGLFGMYYSLNYLSLADATVLTFLGPFTTALAGYLILKETYSKREAIGGVCSLVGVILIARPPFLFGNGGDASSTSDVVSDITPFERLRAVGSALIGVAGGTATLISMRAIGKRAHPMHVMTFFSFWCVVVGAATMMVIDEPVVFPMTWQWIVLLLVIGLLGVAAQILLTMGLQRETATRSAMGSYCQLLFAAVLQFVVFGTVPSLSSLAGAAIIMAAAAYSVLSKQKAPDQNSIALRTIPEDDVEEGLLAQRGSGEAPDGPTGSGPNDDESIGRSSVELNLQPRSRLGAVV